ncbi:hypothetical protein [Acidovorax sp. sic0104]|nr:hypothetical protein [Acidovorax sp. sic0104]
MDKKLRSREGVSGAQSVGRDPEAVARILVANLNRIKIDMKAMSRLPARASAQYVEESYLALACAQLLAIDRTVKRLDIRGPLIGHYKKLFPPKMAERFEAYKLAYTQKMDITPAFAASLGLVGHEVLAVNLSALQSHFKDTLLSATKELHGLGFAA